MNAICKILGIQYPIIQGAMAQISMGKLVAAVSNGGGLGTLASSALNGEAVREEIRRTRTMTDKPFAVNIPMLSPYADEVAQVVIEEKVPFVVTAAGNPKRFMQGWKDKGIGILSVVATPKQAAKMEDMGADIIIAEGCESGGHVGLLTTMALIPQVRAAVKLPVVCAGGIATGDGMAAAFQLGAQGVQLGTLFLSALENEIHQNYMKAILQANAEDAVVTGRLANHAVRCLKNQLTEAFSQLDKQSLDVAAYEKLGAGALRKAVAEGDMAWGSVMAGQIVGLVKEQKSAAQIISQLVADYNAALGRLQPL